MTKIHINDFFGRSKKFRLTKRVENQRGLTVFTKYNKTDF